MLSLVFVWQLVVTCLIWEDSTALRSGWMSSADALAEMPVTVYSCGVLIGEDENKIVLSMDLSAETGMVNQSGLVMKSLVRQRLDIDVAAEADRQDAAKASKMSPPKKEPGKVRRFFKRQGARALLLGVSPAFVVASAVRRTKEPLRLWWRAFKVGTIDE